MIVKKNKWKKDRMRYKQIKKKNSVTAQNMIIKKKKLKAQLQIVQQLPVEAN